MKGEPYAASIFHSASRASTFRRDSRYFTYSMIAVRIASGDLPEYRNGLVDLAIWLRQVGARPPATGLG